MFTFSTGDLVMKAHRSDPFLISYYGDGKILTSTDIRSDGYMQNTKNGQAYMAENLSLVYPGWVTLCLEHRSPPGSLLQLVSLSLLHRV